jgi:hypothetical protein
MVGKIKVTTDPPLSEHPVCLYDPTLNGARIPKPQPTPEQIIAEMDRWNADHSAIPSAADLIHHMRIWLATR